MADLLPVGDLPRRLRAARQAQVLQTAMNRIGVRRGFKALKQNIMRQVQRRGETKMANNFTLAGSTIAVASSDPSSALVTAISQGAPINQREGNQVLLKRIVCKYSINPSATPSVGRVRMIFFVDKQPVIGTPVTYSALFTAQSAGNEFLANRNVNNYPRFKILFDKTLKWDRSINNAVATTSQKDGRINLRFKGNGMKLRYTSGTSTDVQRSHVYFLVVTDLSVNQPTIRLDAQLHFKDPS